LIGIVEFLRAVVWAEFFFSYILLDCLKQWQSISLAQRYFSFKPDSSNSQWEAVKEIEDCIAEDDLSLVVNQ